MADGFALQIGLAVLIWLALGAAFGARRKMQATTPQWVQKTLAALWLGRIAIRPALLVGVLAAMAWVAWRFHRTGSSLNTLQAVIGSHVGVIILILALVPALGVVGVALLVWRHAGELVASTDEQAG